MKRRALLVRLAAAPAILPFFAAHLRAAATDLTGTWTGTLVRQDNSGGDAETPAYVILKQNGREVTGSGGPSESEQYPLSKGLLEGDTYDTIVVSGADILTHFVVSGFQSFKAVSSEICKPYDAARDGISLGEACGTMILSNRKELVSGQAIAVLGGASSNDANHISGPSRTGEGLLTAIGKTLKEAQVAPSEVDYISGHGTATLYNDEMEAHAITSAQLQQVPMNSLKGYFGHTLGAAGLVEAIAGIHSMRNNTLIGTYNFNELGVSLPLNIIRETEEKKIDTCLKTAAGFGGCNAAVLFRKLI